MNLASYKSLSRVWVFATCFNSYKLVLEQLRLFRGFLINLWINSVQTVEKINDRKASDCNIILQWNCVSQILFASVWHTVASISDPSFTIPFHALCTWSLKGKVHQKCLTSYQSRFVYQGKSQIKKRYSGVSFSYFFQTVSLLFYVNMTFYRYKRML